MIRKVGLVVATVVFFAGVVLAPVSAQSPSPSASPTPTPEAEFDYEKAYKDYVFALDVYESAHSDYLLTRAQYLQAKTLIAETRARDSAVAMLEARDDVVVTYLRALRMRLVVTPGVTAITRDGYLTRLDVELDWFSDHKDRISSVGNLQDVVADSNDARGHFSSVTEGLCYEVLSVMSLGKLGVLREDMGILLGDIKFKAAEIRLKGDHDVQTVERWILAAENKTTRALDKEIEAQGLIQGLVGGKKGSTVYDGVLTRSGESLQFLKEASSNIREIIRAIRTKD